MHLCLSIRIRTDTHEYGHLHVEPSDLIARKCLTQHQYDSQLRRDAAFTQTESSMDVRGHRKVEPGKEESSDRPDVLISFAALQRARGDSRGAPLHLDPQLQKAAR